MSRSTVHSVPCIRDRTCPKSPWAQNWTEPGRFTNPRALLKQFGISYLSFLKSSCRYLRLLHLELVLLGELGHVRPGRHHARPVLQHDSKILPTVVRYH